MKKAQHKILDFIGSQDKPQKVADDEEQQEVPKRLEEF